MYVYFTDIFLSMNDVSLKIDWREMYELAKLVVDKKEKGESPDRLQFFTEYIFDKNL